MLIRAWVIERFEGVGALGQSPDLEAGVLEGSATQGPGTLGPGLQSSSVTSSVILGG